MTLIFALIVLLWINLVSPAVVTTGYLKVKCDPVYQGLIVQRDNEANFLDCIGGSVNEDARLEGTTVSTCIEYKFCADRSLRRVDKTRKVDEVKVNIEECITNENNIIKNKDCDMLETVAKKLKWNVVDTKQIFSENDGKIEEKLVHIKSTDDKCITKSGTTTSITLSTCDILNEAQQFYFQTRGKVLKQGKIYNKSLKKCIADAGPVLDNCVTTPKKIIKIKYYESGQIVKHGDETNDWCLGAATDNSVSWNPCSLTNNQKWDATRCNEEDSCLFLNIGQNKCLKFSIDKPTVSTCIVSKNTLFNFVYRSWDTSTTEWTKLGCNQDGKITIEIQNEVTYGKATTNEVGGTASLTLSGETPFVNVEASVSASINLAKTWEENYGSTVKSIMTCENYEDSETDKFTHGCMWQLQVSAFNRDKVETLKWRPPIVKCTRSADQPKCVPFMKCKTKLCTQCIPENQLTTVITTTNPLRKTKKGK